ncbi:hypothetical protein E2C01_034930 [Portunus trituberculatus]|uniref:Uncharacterized protein n=1 Tax=Portunus trituberculatus TaxID=210409 RepID=A0A5B7F462_PORTR|nr:hypothetical protein [Portunus trituberculatus]
MHKLFESSEERKKINRHSGGGQEVAAARVTQGAGAWRAQWQFGSGCNRVGHQLLRYGEVDVKVVSNFIVSLYRHRNLRRVPAAWGSQKRGIICRGCTAKTRISVEVEEEEEEEEEEDR